MDLQRWLRCQWDRAAAVGAALIGLIALLLGWLGVSRSGLPAAQIPYLASGAVLGLFALGVAATLWLSADLRDEWRKLDDIYEEVKAQREATEVLVASAALAQPVSVDPDPTPANGARPRPRRARAASK
jgi:hypothetical protein